MEASRVDILLATWERTTASLVACRAALEAHGWDPSRALAELDALEPSTPLPPPRADLARTPSALLSKYKKLAREHRDVSEGTLPRSLVWVTERAMSATPRVMHWERHRFFLGAPVERWFPADRGTPRGPLLYGGYARLERDATQPRHASADEEARLAMHDARWIMERLARFSARCGTRIAAELRGRTGWIDAAGPDAALREAYASAPLDAAVADALLDEHPRRRTDVSDCGWAAHCEVGRLLAARVLRDVDLTDDAAPARAAERAVKAAAKAQPHALRIARALYRSDGDASFTDVLDRLLLEQGLGVIGPAWKPVTREAACTTFVAALTTSLAYGSPMVPATEARRIVDAFVGTFDVDAMFYRNGDDNCYTPVLGTTLERGAAVIDAGAAGILFVGDED